MRVWLSALLLGILAGWFLAPFESANPSTAGKVEAGRQSILANALRGSSASATFAAMSEDRLTEIERLRLSAAWCPPKTVAGLLAALRELSGLDPDMRATLQNRILLQLIRVDATAGFRAIAESGSENRASVLGEYVGLWAAEDPTAVDAAIRSLKGEPALSTELAKRAGEAMAEGEPRLAAALVLDFNVSFHGGSLLEKAFARIAEESPSEAAELAFAIEDWQARGWAVRNVMREWGKRDGRAAIDDLQAREITDANHGTGWWSALFSGWAEDDPQEALKGIEEVPKSKGLYLRREVLETWAKSEPRAALDHARGIEDEAERQNLFGALSNALASEHPEFALEALLESDRPREGAGLFRTFAEKDWEGTMATLGQWGDPDFRAQAAASMISYAHYNGRQISDGERDQLLDWIAEAPSSVPSHVVGDVLEYETIAALSSRHPDLYEQLLPRTIRSMTSSDPRQALELLESMESDSLFTRNSREEAINAWALQEPVEAAAWAEADPAAGSREGAFFNVASAWSSVDPAGAEAWIASLESPAIRDQAARGFAETVMFRDSEAAMEIVGQITDVASRHEAQIAIWGQRLERDVIAARREMENADIPEAVREALEPRLVEAEAWHRLTTSDR